MSNARLVAVGGTSRRMTNMMSSAPSRGATNTLALDESRRCSVEIRGLESKGEGVGSGSSAEVAGWVGLHRNLPTVLLNESGHTLRLVVRGPSLTDWSASACVHATTLLQPGDSHSEPHCNRTLQLFWAGEESGIRRQKRAVGDADAGRRVLYETECHGQHVRIVVASPPMRSADVEPTEEELNVADRDALRSLTPSPRLQQESFPPPHAHSASPELV